MAATVKTIDIRDTTAQRENRKTRRHAGQAIRASETILLLPHCLRVSSTCRATAGEDGLDCVECNAACQVNILRKTAMDMGFRGVCVAPGGSLALKYVRKTMPLAIVAVACEKELSEGVTNVKELFGGSGEAPAVTIIPLVKDGCIDTRVDIKKAIAEISGTKNNFDDEYTQAELMTGSDRR